MMEEIKERNTEVMETTSQQAIMETDQTMAELSTKEVNQPIAVNTSVEPAPGNTATTVIVAKARNRTKIVNAIWAIIEKTRLEREFDELTKGIKSASIKGDSALVESWQKNMADLVPRLTAVAKVLNEGPKNKAQRIIDYANEIANHAACLGGHYSGDNGNMVRIHNGPDNAYTSSSRGDQYSSRCTWHKTDATHVVELNIDTLPLLTSPAGHDLVEATKNNNDRRIVVIGKGKGTVKWIERGRGKRIKLRSGWGCMAGESAVLSEKSYKDALERAAQLVAEAL